MPNLGVSPAYCGPVREKRRRQLCTAIEIFYLFSPWPGSNKIIAGGEEGEFFGSSVPGKEFAPIDLTLKLAAALCAAPKNLTVLSAVVRSIFLAQ
jgi:hypothetical protein